MANSGETRLANMYQDRHTPNWPTELPPPITSVGSPAKLTLRSKVGFNPTPTGLAARRGKAAVANVKGIDAASA